MHALTRLNPLALASLLTGGLMVSCGYKEPLDNAFQPSAPLEMGEARLLNPVIRQIGPAAVLQWAVEGVVPSGAPWYLERRCIIPKEDRIPGSQAVEQTSRYALSPGYLGDDTWEARDPVAPIGQICRYRVKAGDLTEGITTPWADIRLEIPPDPLVAVTASASEYGVRIEWDSGESPNSGLLPPAAVVFRLEDGHAPLLLTPGPVYGGMLLDEHAPLGKVQYRAHRYQRGALSDPVLSESVQVTSAPALPAVQRARWFCESQGIRLLWDPAPVAGAAYVVERRSPDDPDAGWIRLSESPGRSPTWLDTEARRDMRYQYRILSVRSPADLPGAQGPVLTAYCAP